MYDELVSELREKAEFLACAEPLNIKNAFAESMKQAADAIDKLVATVGTAYNELANNEANKPRWIPVTERLPEEHEWVLCKCRANIHEVLSLRDGYWYHDPQHQYMSGFVTHWMPLPPDPKPPKEET